MRKHFLAVALVTLFAQSIVAGEATDDPLKVRRIPPPGAVLKAEDRAELEKGVDALGKDIAALKDDLKDKPQLLELLPDVQIYFNAVHYALKYDEFFNIKEPAKDVAAAKLLLQQGGERAKALREGSAPWASAPSAKGRIVRGYVSKIDGSVQPYGLLVPESFDPKAETKHRLDIWYHGRGEDLSELRFIMGQQESLGEVTPKDAFVLHPYGRYCNANKFAGEVDTFEALDDVKTHYKIDENRISVRGFSMGGASCWQFATHFPGLWAAAAPGAGFAETPEFTHVFDPKNTGPKPTDFEQKLWHIYDSTHYAENLFNLPTIAYSGELDGQKQAADIMARTMKEYGLELRHIIGPGAKHNYEAKAKEELNRQIDEIVAKGRNPVPTHIKFTTYTLRYNQAFWITINALEEHWKKARIDASIEGKTITATAENIVSFTIKCGPGFSVQKGEKIKVVINGQAVSGSVPDSGNFHVHRYDANEHWTAEPRISPFAGSLQKWTGHQGPIDDAFMDSFVMVAPTGKAFNEKTGDWVKGEMAHAIEHWRRTYRGEARVVNDDQVSDDVIKNSNLVLWGDPSSNKMIAKILDRLPIKWDEKGIVMGGETYASGQHIPLLIFPNPLNPNRSVVLNSGITFRENEYLNNAKQNAKLPDWAIIDVSEPPTSRWPGKVVKADFFDEFWKVKK